MPYEHSLFTAGSTALGTVLLSGSPAVVRALGGTDVDFLMVDQHVSIDLETIRDAITAATLVDIPVLVRVPESQLSIVITVLDAGAAGVVVRGVESADTVRAVAEETRYADGRSFSPFTPAGAYGDRYRVAYRDRNDGGVALIPLIETEPGLASVERIAAESATTAVREPSRTPSIQSTGQPGDTTVALGRSSRNFRRWSRWSERQRSWW